MLAATILNAPLAASLAATILNAAMDRERRTDTQRKSNRREKVIISAINTHKTSLSRKREQISEEMVKIYSSFTVNTNCLV